MNFLFEDVKTKAFSDNSSKMKLKSATQNEKNNFMDKSDFKNQDKMNYFKMNGSFLK